jgi:hypothetical protein
MALTVEAPMRKENASIVNDAPVAKYLKQKQEQDFM